MVQNITNIITGILFHGSKASTKVSTQGPKHESLLLPCLLSRDHHVSSKHQNIMKVYHFVTSKFTIYLTQGSKDIMNIIF